MPIWDIAIHASKPIREYPLNSDTSLGAALKRERLSRGWTQEQTGNYLGLLLPNYSRFEWNVHLPDIQKRKKINEFLKFNFWDDGTNSLSNKLLLYRIENQLTAIECGTLIGVSRNTIKRIELKIKVSFGMMEKVCTYLKANSVVCFYNE
ncbi:helix-turn-helix domain-containing protein [Aquimarina sp. 2201CG14-23]|uniref:helix-turn-helix domain-containing protein n=1 Tax=Aquimarina mycalae TaxID=3040073 RepID=UPI0024782E8F|nr:helix-turn-helix transcriptional regulator [Aquimarina sp. 2201CG14-23]MDH7447247.1 helix-turn-helix transcriptional regulator [Aquimarina sp. 2201CG14-23]